MHVVHRACVLSAIAAPLMCQGGGWCVHRSRPMRFLPVSRLVAEKCKFRIRPAAFVRGSVGRRTPGQHSAILTTSTNPRPGLAQTETQPPFLAAGSGLATKSAARGNVYHIRSKLQLICCLVAQPIDEPNRHALFKPGFCNTGRAGQSPQARMSAPNQHM